LLKRAVATTGAVMRAVATKAVATRAAAAGASLSSSAAGPVGGALSWWSAVAVGR
jgi:hypothetical protein